MGKLYDEIPESHFEWIEKQHVFFVATAPLSAPGHVNMSPKGIADCFHVVDSKQVWYEDLTGSGVETISHVRENGRITIMFCAFDGPPRILRLFGVGTVHEYGSPEYTRLIPPTSRKPGSRSAIVIDVYKVGTSCGFGVPLYDFVMHRTQHGRTSDKVESVDRRLAIARATGQGNEEQDDESLSLHKYWLLENSKSLDGLPGLTTAPEAILEIAPQSKFDKDGPRPMLRRENTTDKPAFSRAYMVCFGVSAGCSCYIFTYSFRGRVEQVNEGFVFLEYPLMYEPKVDSYFYPAVSLLCFSDFPAR
ncbi:hypothetical protein JVU11DRAFT_8638 [Chiua virens]|nr:hypothetical protein JVU11DRAFT_8638 [Chiua virens]